MRFGRWAALLCPPQARFSRRRAFVLALPGRSLLLDPGTARRQLRLLAGGGGAGKGRHRAAWDAVLGAGGTLLVRRGDHQLGSGAAAGWYAAVSSRLLERLSGAMMFGVGSNYVFDLPPYERERQAKRRREQRKQRKQHGSDVGSRAKGQHQEEGQTLQPTREVFEAALVAAAAEVGVRLLDARQAEDPLKRGSGNCTATMMAVPRRGEKLPPLPPCLCAHLRSATEQQIWRQNKDILKEPLLHAAIAEYTRRCVAGDMAVAKGAVTGADSDGMGGSRTVGRDGGCTVGFDNELSGSESFALCGSGPDRECCRADGADRCFYASSAANCAKEK